MFMKIKKAVSVIAPVIFLSLLFFSESCHHQNEIKKNPTFSEDIAPVIFKNCSPCHHPGEAGPFSLLTYQDVLKKAKTVMLVTQARYMPPWPADASYTHFTGERVLTDDEIEIIKRWVENDCPPGDPARLPAQPVFPEGSMSGKPDLVVKMREPYVIKGDNKDRFMVIKIPYEIAHDTFIRAIEFVPGNRQLLHHMNGHLIAYEGDKKKNIFEGPDIVNRDSAGTLEESYKAINLLNDDGSYPELIPSVSNHLPGVQPVIYPEGIGGWVLKKKGAFLMRDIHYGPSAVDAQDQSYFNIFFAAQRPARPTMETQLGTLGISDIVPPLVIPADSIKTFTTRAVIQNDISLLAINPHMHLLGKSFWAYAIKPGGDTIRLIKIPKWDFRWQYCYTFPKMLKIPKGTTITVVGVYDNTVKNPNNPFFPPREITGKNGSMRTTDEMFQFIMTFLPYNPGDENISLEGKVAGGRRQ
jgi:copper type II ascorbate-dependent monooxygenase-like protein